MADKPLNYEKLEKEEKEKTLSTLNFKLDTDSSISTHNHKLEYKEKEQFTEEVLFSNQKIYGQI